MNLGIILKMLGVKFAPEHVARIEEMIPQVPAKVNQAIAVMNGALRNFDDRLKAIENKQIEILEVLRGQRTIGSGEYGENRDRGTGSGDRGT